MIQSATFFTKQGERKMATPIRNLMKTCAAIALAAQNLFAHDGTEWIGDVGWWYSVENGEATIVSAVKNDPTLIPTPGTGMFYYEPAGGDLVVPATVGDGIPVTTVEGAGGNEEMTGLTIPAGVRTIGPWAFRWNFALAYVTIPDTVTEIKEEAFQECTNLTQITLPPRLAKIGERAFARCYNLNRVVIPSTLKSISIDAFRECDALKEVLIPNGVEEIGESAFSLCRSLTDVTIPASVKSCGPHAFSNCSGLKRATLNAVGPSDYMFLNCTSLTDVTIPEGATGVGIGSFWGCSSLRSIVLPRSLRFVDSKAFKDCASLQSITMPRACYKTYTDAYAGCPETLQFVFWEDGGGSGGGSGGGGSGGGSATPGYDAIDEKDIVAPYDVPKAATVMGAAYDGDGAVVGIVELKLGKVNAKKGTGKVSGSFIGLDGKKLTLKAANADGIDGTAPATVSLEVKNVGTMTVKIGGDKFAGSLGGWHVQSGAVGGDWTGRGATVGVDAGDVSMFAGTVLTDLLPNDEQATANGGKWAFKKAAGVKWAKPKKGAEPPEIYDEESGKGLIVDTSKDKTNLSGLKLTYTPKKGTFKGSFKVYALEGEGKATKLKKYTVKVNGVVVDSVGYGTAMCKKPAASWPVTVR